MQPTLAVLHASASENFVLLKHWRAETETYPIETTENHPWTLWISRNHLPLTNSFELSQPRCPRLWQTQLPKARLCLRGFGGPVWIGLTPYKTQTFAASQRLLQNLRTSLCIVFDPVRFIYVARVVLLALVVERQFGDFRHIRLLQCRVRSLFDRCHGVMFN